MKKLGQLPYSPALTSNEAELQTLPRVCGVLSFYHKMCAEGTYLMARAKSRGHCVPLKTSEAKSEAEASWPNTCGENHRLGKPARLGRNRPPTPHDRSSATLLLNARRRPKGCPVLAWSLSDKRAQKCVTKYDYL